MQAYSHVFTHFVSAQFYHCERIYINGFVSFLHSVASSLSFVYYFVYFEGLVEDE